MNPIITQLLEDGWREYPDQFEPNARAFAKSFEGHAECQGNQGKRKQVELYYNPADSIYGHVFKERFVVKFYGELPDGCIIRATIENAETFEQITATVQRVLSMWDHLSAITPKTIKNDD
jgi:hypothetical protein